MFRTATVKIAHSSTIPSLTGNKDLKLLQDVITAEKTVLTSLQKLSVDFDKAAEALRLWGFGEGKDLLDILAASANLLGQFSTAISKYAQHEDTIREHMKSIRSREEALHDLKRRRKTLISKADAAERKLSKMSRGNKNISSQMDALDGLRKDIGVMDSEIMCDEAALGDLKRSKTKTWMGLKFGGLLECCEKGTIIGKFGQLVVAEIPEEHTQPGMLRSPDIDNQRVNSLLGDATRCVDEVVFTAVGDTSTYPPEYHATPQRMGTGHFIRPSRVQSSVSVSPSTAPSEQLYTPDNFGRASMFSVHSPYDFGMGSMGSPSGSRSSTFSPTEMTGYFLQDHPSSLNPKMGDGDDASVTSTVAALDARNSLEGSAPSYATYQDDLSGLSSGASTPPVLPSPWESFPSPDSDSNLDDQRISTYSQSESTGYFLQNRPSSLYQEIGEGDDLVLPSFAAALNAQKTVEEPAPSYDTYHWQDQHLGSSSRIGTPPVSPSIWEPPDSLDLDSKSQRISTYDDDVAEMFDPLHGNSDILPEVNWGPSLQEQEDYMIALAQQLQYDNEDFRLGKEALDLKAATPLTFICGVCMDVTDHTDLAMVENCEHKFCRECFLQYLLSKIRDRRFPITCPTCMSDNLCHANPSIIELNLIEQMNIPQKDYEILEEMMLSSHCVPVYCSRCSRTALMDREEYQECTVVICPLLDCVHVWCKKCSQSIDTEEGGPIHSCDGTNEFESLMREKGWRACPGCNTNFQKEEGCNHMTCSSAGCNMNFCYRCGKAIIRSAVKGEIDDAIKEHYSSCLLFEVGDEVEDDVEN